MASSKVLFSLTSSSVFACLVSTLGIGNALAQGITTVEGHVHAKGVVLLRATVPSVPCPRYTTVRVVEHHPGREEEPSSVTIGGAYRQSAIIQNETCSLLVPGFAGPTDHHEIGFAFPYPGTYQVRWEFGTTGVSPVDVAIDQTVRIEPSTRSDLRFLGRVSDPRFLRTLFGRDQFESAPPEGRAWVLSPAGADYRALLVIRELLETARAEEPGDVIGQQHRGDIEPALRWADSLWPLARELADSSYAPYAAFYAGLCYWGAAFGETGDAVREARLPGQQKDHAGEILKRAELLKADDRLAKGSEALQFAADHGDAYLRARALYHLGFLRACAGQFDEADELLMRAVQLGGERGTIGDMVGKFRSELQNMKQAMTRRQLDGQP